MSGNDQDPSRTIIGTEVRKWYGTSRDVMLSDAQYEEIAIRLTGFMWPSDPPTPPDSPWLPKPSEAVDDDKWWDFDATFSAATTLLNSLPAMIAHWERCGASPHTRNGLATITALRDALLPALPYIQWPLGRHERRTGRKSPKMWHLPSVLIAHIIIDVTLRAGKKEPALSRNSVLVRVVHNALIRMKYPDAGMISRTAIAAHLTRWNDKYGLMPTTIATAVQKAKEDLDHKVKHWPLLPWA